MTTSPTIDFAIIGAGLSGCYCSYLAAQMGFESLVIEKSRGTGGRASSKQLPDTLVDLGAPLINFKHPELMGLKDTLLDQQLISAWQDGYIGMPKMSSITRFLLGNSHLLNQTKAHHIERSHGNWLIRDDRYQPICTAKHIIVAAPAIQAASLLATVPNSGALLEQANQAGSHTYPQWVLWAQTAKTSHPVMLQEVSPEIDKLIKDSDKPNRALTDKETWVVHAGYEWTKQHLDHPKEWVAQQLIKRLENHLGVSVINHGEPHRWLLGRQFPLKPQERFLWDSQLSIGVVGDWLSEGNAEGALLSANHLFSYLSTILEHNDNVLGGHHGQC